MQEKEIKCKPFYVKVAKPQIINTNLNITFGGNIRFYKFRPRQEDDYVLYKFSKYYEIIPTEEEKTTFIEKHKWDSRNQSTGFGQFYNEITNSEEYHKSIYRYELIENYYNFVNVYKSTNWYDFDKIPYTIEFADHIYIIKIQDGKQITDYTKAELKDRQRKKEQEAEYKVISNILKPSIDAVLIKYGMVLKSDGIHFKDMSEYYKFVKQSLNTVIQDLNENGYNVKLNPRCRSIKYSSLIVNKKDIKLKNEEN